MPAVIPIRADQIHTPEYPIDAMPTLAARLGKGGCARIRYHQDHSPPAPLKGRAKALENTCLAFMQEQVPHGGGPVDDILSGIARLDWGTGKALSVELLYAALQCLPVITTDAIARMLAVQERQARRYVAALELCLQQLVRHRASMQPFAPPDSPLSIP